jgi:hypothetical protein
VQKNEAALLKEFVNRAGSRVAHAKHSTHGVRSRSQMRDGPQEFERMAFLLQRVSVGNRTDDFDLLGVKFEALALARRIDQLSGRGYRATRLEMANLVLEVFEPRLGNDLKTRETRAIADLEKRNFLRMSRSAHPAVQRDDSSG